MGRNEDYRAAPAQLEPELIGPFAGKTLYFPERARVSGFDSSLESKMYQIYLDGRRYCVDQGVLAVLDYFRAGIPAEKALQEKSGQTGARITPQLVQRLFDRGLLRTAQSLEQETLKGRGPRANRPAGMFFLIPILTEGTITRIAALFRILFRPVIAASTGIFILLCHVLFIVNKHASRQSARLSSEELVCLIGLVLVALLFHEIGHASASEYYGVHPHALGFGIFWIYPVLFTDVSGTWGLKRWQRAVVAASGLYFHLIASSIACIVGLFVTSPVPTLLVYSIWLAVFLNGNPFIQFDGYWIVTDLLGVPNLRYQTHSLLKRAVAVVAGRTPPDQGLWESTHKTRIPVLIYTIAYCGFILYVADAVVYRIIPRLFVSVPLAYQSIVRLIANERFDWTALATLWRVAVVIIMIAGIVRMLQRVVAYLYRGIRPAIAKSERRLA